MPRLNSSIQERILKRVDTNDPALCWNWQGTKSGGKYGGYGMIKIDWKNRMAHRVSYEQFVGPIPSGMVIMHSCDNPSCVNPAHLSAGSQSENLRECYGKGRRSARKGAA